MHDFCLPSYHLLLVGIATLNGSRTILTDSVDAGHPMRLQHDTNAIFVVLAADVHCNVKLELHDYYRKGDLCLSMQSI